MKYKNYLLIAAVTAAITFAITRYYFPCIEEKQVVQEKEVIKKDIRTVVKEVRKPDGTVETITETTDKSKETKKRDEEFVKYQRKDWYLSAGMGTDNFERTVYNISINRRIIGPLYLGASASTNKQYFINVGMEF